MKHLQQYEDFLNESNEIAAPLDYLMNAAKIKASDIIIEEFEKLLKAGQTTYPFLKGWKLEGMKTYFGSTLLPAMPEESSFVLLIEEEVEKIVYQFSLIVFWNKSGVSVFTQGNFYFGLDSIQYQKRDDGTHYLTQSARAAVDNGEVWESPVKRSSYFTSLNALLGWIKKSLKEAHKDENVRIEFDPTKRGQRAGKKFGF